MMKWKNGKNITTRSLPPLQGQRIHRPGRGSAQRDPEELVVYRQEYGEHGLWVRPKQMFWKR